VNEASIKRAIARCKRAVTGARTVPVTARSELGFACNKVVDRIGKEAQELRQVICEELEHSSSSPVASVREHVLKACEVEAAG
jgi:hypothetical protein